MKRWIVIVAGAVLFIWLPFVFVQSRRAPEPDEQEPLPERGGDPSAMAAEPGPAPVAEPAAAADEPARALAPAQRAEQGDRAQPKPERAPAAPGEVPPPSAEGPLDELAAAYAREPRDAEAPAHEARIRALFGTKEVPADMLRNASCRKSVCKVGVQWSVANQHAYMIALMGMINSFDHRIAWRPAGPPDRDGRHPIDVYVARKQ